MTARADALVGRARELEFLRLSVSEALRRRGPVVNVIGEPLIGKTALLDALAVGLDRVRLLRVAADPTESAFSYCALRDLLLSVEGEFAERLAPEEALALRGTMGLERVRGSSHAAIADAATSALASLARDGPVVCVIDNAHAADADSLGVLQHCAARLRAVTVAFVLSGREPSSMPAEAVTIRLEAIDRPSARSLLRRAEPRPIQPQVEEALLDFAAGVPGVLVSCPTLLSDAQISGRAMLAIPPALAPHVRLALSSWWTQLDEDVLACLIAVAAEPQLERSQVEAVLHALGAPREVLSEAEDAGLVVLTDSRCEATRPAVAAAAYHSATPSGRRHVHAAITASMTGSDARRARALHAWRSALGLSGEAAEALAQAAHCADEEGLPFEAAELYERAAAVSEEHERRLTWLLASARLALEGGNLDDVLRCSREIVATSDDESQRRSAHTISVVGNVCSGHHDIAVSSLAELAANDAAADNARLAMALTAVLARDPGSYAAVAARLLKSANGAADLVYWLGSGDGRRAADAARGLLEHEFAEHPSLVGLARALAELTLARYEAARKRAAELGPPPMARQHWSLACRVVELEALVASGAMGEAAAYVRAGLAAARDLQNQAARIRFLQGALRVSAARGVDDPQTDAEVEDLVAGIRSAADRAEVSASRGLLRLSQGRADEAAAFFDEARAQQPTAAWHAVWRDLSLDHVEALARTGRIGEARRLLADVTRTGRDVPPADRVAARRCEALLVEGPEREALLEEALGQADRHEAAMQYARTSLCLGEHLRRDRRKAAARTALLKAAEIFRELGADAWSARADLEYKATGLTVRDRMTVKLDTLTPQELRVASIVGRGGANREAAAELEISIRTVEQHVSNICRKLVLNSRADLIRMHARGELSDWSE
jgi:DNA-binding CsgD family transcriptional regulator